MKQILSLACILAGLSFVARGYEGTRVFAELSIQWFLPGMGAIFLLSYFLSLWFLKVIDQPPLMIYILTIVIKMLASLTLLLVYLLGHHGPQKEGAILFVLFYLIFEILEIKRFLSILRPDSQA